MGTRLKTPYHTDDDMAFDLKNSLYELVYVFFCFDKRKPNKPDNSKIIVVGVGTSLTNSSIEVCDTVSLIEETVS